ncbi:MAG: amidophosphoribosyltransferase [Sporomusaceae bacterium]|nr:amidophosphoribosyltransferase [Sporomusaceae bacterium]
MLGIYSKKGKDVELMAIWGLLALQHRGQAAAGITLSDGKEMIIRRGMGLVNDVFAKGLPAMDAKIAIGHVRYPSKGFSLSQVNTQPLLVNYAGGQISLANSGSLTNAKELRDELEAQGAIFQSSIHGEIIMNLISRSQAGELHEKILDTVKKLTGSYCLTIMTNDKLIGVRDPHGFRPLCIGKLGEDGWVLAAESCALDTINATFVRDVLPGELVVIDQDGLHSHQFAQSERQAKCIFEYVYFARPDSTLDGKSIYDARIAMGEVLARESGLKADIVISVPDSGTPAAIGFGRESGVLFAQGLIKNRYIGRTFIQPGQKFRETSVHLKLNPVSAVVKDKSVIIVDDSIVRGTTSKKIIKILKDAGAKEVHMCISSPPVEYPCYYGIDTSERSELIAVTKSLDEIKEFIGADSLFYLSFKGLEEAIGAKCENSLCTACFNGKYPTPVPCQK